MPVTIASIPHAEELLSKIDKLRAEPGRQRAFEAFFVRYRDPPPGVEAPFLSNVVFQGGGVLGLAHVGFLFGLERAGIRCACVAGTSAGAIVATSLACARGGDLLAPVAGILLDKISRMPMGSFVDGPAPIRRLIKHILSKGGLPPPTLWWAVIQAVLRLLKSRGLNPGVEFEAWLDKTFEELGVPTNAVLESHLAVIRQKLSHQHVAFTNPLIFRNGEMVEKKDRPLSPLRVVATGLPSGLKITFPEDLDFLDGSYRSASPAIFVRASMAIPAFFEPKILRVLPEPWRKDVEERLKGLVAPNRIIDIADVQDLYLVDGGLLSNVPVDAFETVKRPPGSIPPPRSMQSAERCRDESGRYAKCPGALGNREQFPTIVATLVQWAKPKPEAGWRSFRRLVADTMRLASAVRLQRDRDAWRRAISSGNESVRIVEVDTSKHNWLNFTMADEEKGQLVLEGLERALTFLETLEG